MKKKAFTLIELIAVLVILAILALIVTPLVMNIIRKARISADKRSIDAYGRSIEIAIAGYLLDTGTFPTSIGELTVEYKGDEVVCSTTQIKSDSSVYLAGCTVGGREVKDYTYGSDKTPPVPTYQAYSVGDEVTYNNVDYYVIKDSDTTEDSVTLLKAEPLTVAEVNQYGAGHVNRYTEHSVGTAYDNNGYGGMAYYSSETCGYDSNNQSQTSGCTTDYAQSEIKYVVDNWVNSKINKKYIVEARLIKINELENLGYEFYDNGSVAIWRKNDNVPTWIYDGQPSFWTMSPNGDSNSSVWIVTQSNIEYDDVIALRGWAYWSFGNAVRPVITLKKSALQS